MNVLIINGSCTYVWDYFLLLYLPTCYMISFASFNLLSLSPVCSCFSVGLLSPYLMIVQPFRVLSMCVSPIPLIIYCVNLYQYSAGVIRFHPLWYQWTNIWTVPLGDCDSKTFRLRVTVLIYDSSIRWFWFWNISTTCAYYIRLCNILCQCMIYRAWSYLLRMYVFIPWAWVVPTIFLGLVTVPRSLRSFRTLAIPLLFSQKFLILSCLALFC